MGWLRGGLKVKVVRHDNYYLASDRLTLSSKEIKDLYKKRYLIEQFFRFLNKKFCLAGCQHRKHEAQRRFVGLLLMAAAAIYELSTAKGYTAYYTARRLILRDPDLVKPLKKLIAEIA